MSKERLYGSTLRKCLDNLVIFMAPRLNMAVLSESEVRGSLREFYEIQLSLDGCWEMKMWLDQTLIQFYGRLRFWQNTLKLVSCYSYMCNFYDPMTNGYFAHLKSGVGFKVIFVPFSEFELTAEGPQRVRNT